MSDYPAAQPHDPIEAVFPDVYLVRGSMRMGPGMRICRNMTVVRHAGELALINAVRLSAVGEAALGELGRIAHVIRLGAFHGLDDRYYVERHGAAFWCQSDSTRYPQPPPVRLLEERAALPFPAMALFEFRHTRYPEAALLLQREGGVLLTCDSVQHYADWRYCSLAARVMMRVMGFSRSTLIGPLWLRHMTPRGDSLRADFARLLMLEFAHLIGAHGSVCRENARAQVQGAVARAFE